MSRNVRAAMLIVAGTVFASICGSGAWRAVQGHAWLEVAGLIPGVGVGLWGIWDGVRVLRPRVEQPSSSR